MLTNIPRHFGDLDFPHLAFVDAQRRAASDYLAWARLARADGDMHRAKCLAQKARQANHSATIARKRYYQELAHVA